MQNYFHPNTAKYKKLTSRFSAAVGILLSLPVLLCFLSIILGYRSLRDPDFLQVRLAVILGCVAVWILLSFFVYAAIHRKSSCISRYTYLEIQNGCVIFSRYSGSWSVLGSRTYARTLYVIPFENTSITYKNGIVSFKRKDGIRRYTGDSDRLGYHIQNGEIRFNNWWLNENGYETIEELSLPNIFAKASFIFRCLRLAQNRRIKYSQRRKKAAAPTPPVQNAPFRKAIRTSAKKRVYSEIPTYNRSW